MTTIQTALISAIGRIRGADAKRVSALADSIREVGLLNPITVYRDQIIRSGQPVDGYSLIAGLHRLRACQELGWSEIPATVIDLGEQERIIAECDENLCGSNLSPAEVALFTARRKAAYLALYPETSHGGDRSSGKLCHLKSFANDQTGQSVRKVRMDASRGEKIAEPVLTLVKGTKLDTGIYLDQLKKVAPGQQEARVKEDLSRRKSVRAAAPEADHEVTERQVAALMSAWNKAGSDARDEFLERINVSSVRGSFSA